jgi:iron complex outermembrane receptor protein
MEMPKESTRTATRGRLLLVSTVAAAALATGVQAQNASQATNVEEVVITGSNIRGASVDTALPVASIGAEEIARRGSPSTLELIKSMPVVAGVLGDTNQFDSRAQGTTGSGSVNLRGLGSERTLVLLNGHRLAANPLVNSAGGAVDTNLLPVAAISRVEILKDGAAAIYGSDAIGGVVNFITRTRMDGGDVAADYRYIKGSDGDYTASLTWGWQWDRADLLLSGGYQHRSTLLVLDRDFANPTYPENPQGGYTSVGNPGTYIPLSATLAALGPAQRDVNCTALGGFAGLSGATPVCYARSTQFDNMVEEEERYQLFGSVNFDVTDTLRLHVEGLYASTVTPEARTTPSQAIVQFPTAEASAAPSLAGRLFVPASNPGFASYVAANPGIFPAGTTGVQLTSYRPFFLGGNPLFGETGGSVGEVSHSAWRVSGGLTGKFAPDLGFDVNLSYMENSTESLSYDTMINRLELALRGLGGPNCDAAPATPGIQGTAGVGGCMYFNPFSTAVPRNSATGAVNPQFNPAAGAMNTRELISWFYLPRTLKQTTTLFVADAVLNGKLPWTLPGGEIDWAFGGQYRRDSYESRPSDILNPEKNPCVATPDFGVTNCASQTGPFGLFAPSSPVDVSGSVWAAFGELHLPITHRLEAQLAARYESYGGSVGSTFNPKASLRFQATPWLALRGSVGTTFRGPPTTATDDNPDTSLQQVRSIFRTVYNFGTPDLKPETAFTYNVGAIVKTGGLRMSLDYWSFDFSDPLTNEPVGPISSALYPSNTTNRCLDPAYAAIRARFTFNDVNGNGSTDDDCVAANIASLKTFTINGSSVKTDGIDFSASYVFEDLWEGSLTFGLDATRVLNYSVDALAIEGVPASAAFEAVGKLNYQTVAYALPPWRGSLYAEYHRGGQNLRWTVNYIDSYIDQRADVFAPSVNNGTTGQAVALPQGQKINEWIVHNVAYQTRLPWDTTLNIAVDNVFDTDPPFVRLNLSYDPFTTNGLGRTIKVGVRKIF